MVESDTIKLLRECDAGIKMGIDSIEDVLSRVQSKAFRQALADCRQQHHELQGEIQKDLDKYQDRGKEPNPIAKGMSWMKTNVKLGLNQTDAAIASLITDGCTMGIKSLNRYLNQYPAADEHSKDIAKKLIAMEEELTDQIRQYL